MGERITITITSQVSALIDQMHAMGLFGLTRAAIAERLVCEGILKRLESGIIKQPPVREVQQKKRQG